MDANNEALKTEIESTRKVVGTVIHLLERINGAVEDGFKEVNERLSKLEGMQGMQGVNVQLVDIKGELQKIQKVYPYDELVKNLKSVTGEA